MDHLSIPARIALGRERLAQLAHMEQVTWRNIGVMKLRPRPITWSEHLLLLHLDQHLTNISWEREEIYHALLNHN